MRFGPLDQNNLGVAIELLLTYRGSGYVHRYPTIWRLKLLLESRVWDFAQDTCLWKDQSGQIAALAFLWKRTENSTNLGLERVVNPSLATSDILDDMLQWAVERVKQISQDKQPIRVGALPLEYASESDIVLLDKNQFHPNTSDYNVYMVRQLDSPKVARTQSHFDIVWLSEENLALYCAAYGFTPVNLAHLKDLIKEQEYQHLLAINSDGEIAGYVECSYCLAESSDGSRRIGWIDYIEVKPEQRQSGLGIALMYEGLHHLQRHNVNEAWLVTTNTNTAAQALFKKVGMRVSAQEYAYVYETQVL